VTPLEVLDKDRQELEAFRIASTRRGVKRDEPLGFIQYAFVLVVSLNYVSFHSSLLIATVVLGMCADPFHGYDLCPERHLGFQPVAISFHVKDDNVVGQETGGRVFRFDVMEVGPATPPDVRDPVNQPFPGVSM
jgi:hypothetical protein